MPAPSASPPPCSRCRSPAHRCRRRPGPSSPRRRDSSRRSGRGRSHGVGVGPGRHVVGVGDEEAVARGRREFRGDPGVVEGHHGVPLGEPVLEPLARATPKSPPTLRRDPPPRTQPPRRRAESRRDAARRPARDPPRPRLTRREGDWPTGDGDPAGLRFPLGVRKTRHESHSPGPVRGSIIQPAASTSSGGSPATPRSAGGAADDGREAAASAEPRGPAWAFRRCGAARSGSPRSPG